MAAAAAASCLVAGATGMWKQHRSKSSDKVLSDALAFEQRLIRGRDDGSLQKLARAVGD